MPERAQDTVEMAKILFGDGYIDAATGKPKTVIISLINANSPMTYDATMLGALKVYARANQACIVTPFILAGAMSPVTVAGTAAQTLAEALSGMAFMQLVNPGSPVVLGSFASSISMQSGAPTFGTPEPALVLFVMAALARRLGVPFRSGGALCGSKISDAQAAYESANTLLPTCLAGVNFVLHTAGWLEGGLAMGYEKFIMDVDQAGMMHTLLAGVDLSENGQAMDAIREVGPGKHFLGCAHTQANFESAFYRSAIADNNSVEQWEAEGSRDMTQRANAIWKKQLASYEAPPLDPAVDEALVDYIEPAQGVVRGFEVLIVLLFRFRELLQRKRIAHLVERLVAGEALGLIHSGPVLLVGREDGVVPVLVPQDFREILAPTRVPSHRRVENELVRHEETVAARHRLLVGVEFRRVDLGEQHRAVGQRLAFLRRLHRNHVGEVVAHLVGRGKIDRVVLRKCALVSLGKGHAGRRDVRQEDGPGARLGTGLRGKIGGDIGHLVARELRRDCIHDGILARAVLQRLQLCFQVARPLRREIRDGVAYAHPGRAVARRAYCGDLCFAGVDIRSLYNRRDEQKEGHSERFLHGTPPNADTWSQAVLVYGSVERVNSFPAGIIPRRNPLWPIRRCRPAMESAEVASL